MWYGNWRGPRISSQLLLVHQSQPPQNVNRHTNTSTDIPKASLKVGLGLVLSIRSHPNIVNNNSLASAAGDLDINRRLTKPRRVLEEVVVLALSLLPSLAAIHRNLDAIDGLVGVDNLNREPVG